MTWFELKGKQRMLYFSGVVEIKIPVVQEFFADDLEKFPDFLIGKL